MLTPEQIRKDIDTDRAELIRLGVEFNKERRELGSKEFAFEKAMAGALVTYEVNWRQLNPTEKRLPGEDVRKAHAMGLVGKAWPEYLNSKANVEALDKLIRIRQSHMSSLQSELNYMSEELRNA